MGHFFLVGGPYHNETGSSMSFRIGLCFLLLVVPGGCRKATAPAAQGQTGTLSVDECMGLFRDTGRGSDPMRGKQMCPHLCKNYSKYRKKKMGIEPHQYLLCRMDDAQRKLWGKCARNDG